MNPHKLCVVVLYEGCSNETHVALLQNTDGHVTVSSSQAQAV
jgi:hypothetical protein